MSPPELNQLRHDFAAIFSHWLSTGELTQAEHDWQRKAIGEGIKRHIHDDELMARVAAHFAELVAGIEEQRRFAEEFRERVKNAI